MGDGKGFDVEIRKSYNDPCLILHFFVSYPSVRSHGTLAMIMVNLVKSWLTMVPLSRSIMANHDTWKACQDNGDIMARSWQGHGKITLVRHVSCF